MTNGTEIRGTFFRLDAHDWRVVYKGVITVLGDVGIFYISGSGSFHHIYRNGGRGYIVRLWNSFLKNQGQGNSYFYDNVDLNSTVYGSTDLRTEPQYFTQILPAATVSYIIIRPAIKETISVTGPHWLLLVNTTLPMFVMLKTILDLILPPMVIQLLR